MIFTIIGAEIRESRVREGMSYYHFLLKDGYEHEYYANLAPLEHLLKDFHRKNGIYWGDREPYADEYIGFIISAEIKREQYLNKMINRVDLLS